MPNEPRPLREALREEVDQLVEATADDVYAGGEAHLKAEIDTARARVNALLSQVPIEFEAREGDDGTHD